MSKSNQGSIIEIVLEVEHVVDGGMRKAFNQGTHCLPTTTDKISFQRHQGLDTRCVAPRRGSGSIWLEMLRYLGPSVKCEASRRTEYGEENTEWPLTICLKPRD